MRPARPFAFHALITTLLGLAALCTAQAQAPLSEEARRWLSEQARPMRAATPAALSDAELQVFGAAVGQARVVALGEQTHGSRQEFELKTRLLRYLHEHKGFDVLLLESGFFDMGRLAQAMARGERLDALAPGNVFYMYARSDAGRGLLRYLDQTQATARPLQLAGIDSQHSGTLALQELLPGLEALLLARKSALPKAEGWPAFKQQAQTLMKMDARPPSAAAQKSFHRISVQLDAALCTEPGSERGIGSLAWWCRIVRSLDSQAWSLWSGGQDYRRDQAMADNALWLIEQAYPGRKLVIWAHIGHLARGLQLQANNPTPLAGNLLGQRLGRDYYVLNLSALDGSFIDYETLQSAALSPAPAHSLEARLGAGPAALVFLNRPDRPIAGLAELPARGESFDYRPLSVANGLGPHWDGLFFFRSSEPVSLER